MERHLEKVKAIKYYLKNSFPAGFWKNSENQRLYFQILSQEFNINKPSEWGTLDSQELGKKKGINTLLINYHNKSLFRALQFNFPGIMNR